jgi:hypothetical protein
MRIEKLIVLLFLILAVVAIVVFVSRSDASACSATSCMNAACSRTNGCSSPRCGCAIREGQPWGRCVPL